MAKTTDKVVGAAGTAKPYVERAIRDEELHESIRTAFAAGREVYNELVGGRGLTGMAHKVASDEELKVNLRTAVEELRRASSRIQAPAEEERKSRHTGLLLIGLLLAILFNPVTGPNTRRWVKNTVSGGGSGDEFGYPAPAAGNGTS